MRLSATHTLVTLDVSHAVYAEIAVKLLEAGYEHAFEPGTGTIDMHGIGIACPEDDKRLRGRPNGTS